MREAIAPLPQYVFMAWCLVKNCQGIARRLWNPNAYYRVHKSQSLISVLILPCPQKPVTDLCPKPDEISPQYPILFLQEVF